MFLDHFGLIEQPFGVTPDPRFLHMGVKHREALASLLYGTDCNRGFLALIAEPGMGKTSLLYQYLEGLRNKARTAFVFQTDCDSRDFMRHILNDLDLDHSGKNLPAMQAMLNELLTAEMKAGRRFILVIDEAQNLEEKVLESVRLLSNFETPWMKLMQIVIAGQPQLAERLTRPSMTQLRQRISSVIRIEPFTPDEINAYIDHRLWVAAYSGAPLFTVGARLAIAKHSGGIPRNINTLCFNSMSVAYGANAKQVDAQMVREGAADVEMESLLPKLRRTSRVVVMRQAPKPLPPARSLAAPRFQPAKHALAPNRMVPAFASFCALLLLATFSWIAWDRGSRTPPFDVLLAGVPPAAPEISRNEPVAQPELAARNSESIAAEEQEPTVKSHPENATKIESSRANPSDAPPAGSKARTAISRHTSIAAGLSQNDEVLTVVVEKEVTLRQLSLQYVGRFDDAVLGEICALNPDVHDASHIEIGQRLRFPLYMRKELKNPSVAGVRSASLETQKDAQ
jgi:type II secretory pathway predicted ATPase ExeA